MCVPFVDTFVSEQVAFGRSPKLAGALAGSRAQRVCATVPSGSLAVIETPMPAAVLYQPLFPSGDDGVSAIVVVGQSGVTASPNATDAVPGSGVATQSCGAVDTTTPGVKTVTCNATDNAGNTGSATLTYVVEYRVLGFFSPVPGSKWKVGQTVPVKVALGDAAGTRISDAAATALAAACRVRFSTSGAQTLAAQCMKYDATMDQFVYTWKLGKQGTGAATIRAAISYPGTSSTTQLTAQITITS